MFACLCVLILLTKHYNNEIPIDRRTLYWVMLGMSVNIYSVKIEWTLSQSLHVSKVLTGIMVAKGKMKVCTYLPHLLLCLKKPKLVL